jgi:hypothetical protein
MHEKLSEVPGLGQVVMCSDCEDVHVNIGCVAFRLPREAFLEFVKMLQAAAQHPHLRGEPAERFSVSFKEGRPCFKLRAI